MSLADFARGPRADGHTAPRLLYSVGEAAERLGLGLTLTNELIRSGRLASVKVGRRRLIPLAALDAFVAELCADAG